MRRASALPVLLLSGWAVPGLALAQGKGQPDPEARWARALQEYNDNINARAFGRRAIGLRFMANTKDARAFPYLASYYLQGEPRDHGAYVAADLLGKLSNRPLAEQWQQLLKRSKRPRDVWLHMQAYSGAFSAGETLEVIGAKRQPALFRAGAVRGLSKQAADADVVAALQAVLGEDGHLPRKVNDRAPLIVTLAAAAERLKKRLGEDDVQAAVGLLIPEVERKKAWFATRLAVARSLGRLLDSDEIYLEAEPWHKLLAEARLRAEREQDAEDGVVRTKARLVGGGTGVQAPEFFGIQGTGKRVVFAIDLSDSMLTPLAEPERYELGDEFPGVSLRSRFDAAREVLKISLDALGPENLFAVVVFGGKAECLSGSRLLPATPKHVKSAKDALDALTAGKATSKRPNGTLKGETNLHGALRLAFRLHDRGLLQQDEHYDPRVQAMGAETIFVLSDGSPTADDYITTDDQRPGHKGSSDLEGGTSNPDYEGQLSWRGPYTNRDHIVREVERMNAFRGVEIHCVAFNDEQVRLLRRICKLTHGQLRQVPQPKPKPKQGKGKQGKGK